MNYTEEWESERQEVKDCAEELACHFPKDAAAVRHARQAGAFEFWASYFAKCADSELTQRKRLERDPKALMAAILQRHPSAQTIADLLNDLRAHLCAKCPELSDVAVLVEEASVCAAAVAEEEMERAEEDEERLQRQFDAGLISRAQMERAYYGDMP